MGDGGAGAAKSRNGAQANKSLSKDHARKNGMEPQDEADENEEEGPSGKSIAGGKTSKAKSMNKTRASSKGLGALKAN